MKTFYILKYPGVSDSDLFSFWRFPALKAAKDSYKFNKMFFNSKYCDEPQYLKISARKVK